MLDITRLLNLPATLTTVTVGASRDELNQPVDTTTDADIVCWVAPEQSDEDTDQTQRQTGRFVGYFPPDLDITGADRLTLGTATYEFDGPPEQWFHPVSTEVIYQTARLVRTV